MVREVRRVPPHWKHPIDENRDYIPLFYGFLDHLQDWMDEYKKILMEELEPRNLGVDDRFTMENFIEDGILDPNSYVHYPKESATWYQMYETVSEGTPVTPPFETVEELATYLSNDSPPWSLENARAFLKAGYAPTFLMSNGGIYTAKNMGELK